MNAVRFSVFIIVLLCVTGGRANAQTMTAVKAVEPINVDGDLSEETWANAPRVTSFTQQELTEGRPATERTEVAAAYDKQALYIAVWCYDSDPDGIIAQKMKRDFNFKGDDNFKVIIDTYHDARNGYLFVTNPNGARFDALVQDNGQQENDAWDGVWNVKTTINDRGWFAEFAIPFSSLKFNPGKEQLWGINFERNIIRKREKVLWQGWTRDSEIQQVSRAGELFGIRGVGSVALVEIKPYGLAGLEKQADASAKSIGHLGADLNWLITPTMKLNLTVNTDFAQVESDRSQVNLTRFSLFYPEKREFFLEGSNYFDFSLGHRIRPFYSRRIGLSADGHAVPILAGARLLGKTGRTTLGGMSIQTAAQDSLPSVNFSVLRWKQDVLQQSSVGIIAVSRVTPVRKNYVYGGDYLYSTSDFLGNKNLQIGGSYAQSYTSDAVEKYGSAQRLFLDFPNDLIDFSMVWDRAGKSFNPETGFLQRENYQMFNADMRYKPRPKFLSWIQQFEFKPFDFNYYVNDDSHTLQSLWSEFRPLGFNTRSGEFFEFNIQRLAENLTNDFEIHDNITVPAGRYWFTRYELQVGTFRGRALSGFFFFGWGDFYKGKRTEWFGRTVWQINKYFSASLDYTQNIINLPQGMFTVNEVGSRIDAALSPDLFSSLYAQWNNDDQELLINYRINWIPTPGTNVYLVLNQGYDTWDRHNRLSGTTILTKVVWRFVP